MKILFSHSFFLFLLLAFGLFSLTMCRSDRSEVLTYFSEQERDTLLANVVTYMGPTPPGANRMTRFKPQFRSYYVEQSSGYRFERYTIMPDSTHYYFMIRPVGEGKLFRRGVGGKFKLNGNLSPIDFEEMWCTPHFKDDSTVRERGGFLFSEMVSKGNIDKYLNMKHYVEWPDATLQYDKKLHEWVAIGNGI